MRRLIASLLSVPLVLAGLSVRPSTAAAVTAAPGYTIDTIATGLKVPRSVVQTDPDTAFVAEFGSWTPKTGSVTKLRRTGTSWTSTRVLTKLDRPSGMLLGPDGKVWVGEVGKIRRFDPNASTIRLEPVISDLPGKGLHPLTTFAFAPSRDLIVNVGSDTNNCSERRGAPTCPSVDGPTPLASLRRYSFAWPAGTVKGWKTIARGLRNSVGLVVHPSGTVLEVDNGRDNIDKADPNLSDAELPHDELNVITEGSNYGWPYCYDDAKNSPEFPKYACASTARPAVLLPAHSAPLGLVYWNGLLFVSLHGYRDTGHRVISYAIDGAGKPIGSSAEVIGDWAERGARKAGGPVSMNTGADGSLWLTDDRNGEVIRLRSS